MMFKEKLKKLPSRIFYILFALVVSFALWMYVEITENEMQTFEVSNIPIVFRNEDLLRDRGFIPTVLTENISIRFSSSRTDMARLTAPGALSVEVNLADITMTGTTQVGYTILWPPLVNENSIDEVWRLERFVTLIIDRETTMNIPVQGTYTGGFADPELFTEDIQFEPRFISVSGPAEIVSRINHAYVPITRENISQTIVGDFEFMLLDDYDEELSEDDLNSIVLSETSVHVTVPVRLRKDISLIVNLFDGASTSGENTRVDITPQTITVSADPILISELGNFNLGTINMNSFGLSESFTFAIPVPEGVRNDTGITTASVYVEILGLELAYLSTANIYVTHVPAGLTANLITQSITVTLRGTAAELERISSDNIRIVADLAGFELGTNSASGRVYISGVDAVVDAIDEYRVVFDLVPEEEIDIAEDE